MKKLLMMCALFVIAAGIIAAPASATYFRDTTVLSQADCEGYAVDIVIHHPAGSNPEPSGLKIVWEVKLFDTTDTMVTSASGEIPIVFTPDQNGHPFSVSGTWGEELCGTYYATAYVKIVDSVGNIWVNYWNGGNNLIIPPADGSGAPQEYLFTSDPFNCICDTGVCTRTQGYWKNHPDAWPTNTIGCVGTKTYALELLNTAPRGDKWLIMVHQYIAAYLNSANGANDACITEQLAAACAWLTANAGSRPVRSWGDMEDVKDDLDDYNNGDMCAPHCDDNCCDPEPPGLSAAAKPAKAPKVKNFPNPFNPVTTLEFTLPEAGFARVEIYNMLGERIDTLVERSFQAGTFTVEWDASRYATGTYFYRLSTANHSVVQKILFVK